MGQSCCFGREKEEIPDVQAVCNGGALTADATDCQGLPREVGNSTAVTLNDVSKNVSITQNLPRDTSEMAQCADVNPDYAAADGSLERTLQQATAVPTRGSSEVISSKHPATPAPAPKPQPKARPADEQAKQAQAAARKRIAAQFKTLADADKTADPSSAVPKWRKGGAVSDSTAGGGKDFAGDFRTMPAAAWECLYAGFQSVPTQDLVHDETLTGPCGEVNAGYSGEVTTKCLLGQLVFDGNSCQPKPCKAKRGAEDFQESPAKRTKVQKPSRAEAQLDFIRKLIFLRQVREELLLRLPAQESSLSDGEVVAHAEGFQHLVAEDDEDGGFFECVYTQEYHELLHGSSSRGFEAWVELVWPAGFHITLRASAGDGVRLLTSSVWRNSCHGLWLAFP
ncbi:unnamed protein product [Durusdinium trenchii]|uniref:Uncharacterized protein n=1 Tax=Durusdinium trenchii TaxID=1381693 RepID=A0ABP0NJS2_9DINO